MIRPTAFVVSLLLLLFAQVASSSANSFDLDQCSACIAKGCGYCQRKLKDSDYATQAICQCDRQLFNYGAACNDISKITDGQDYGRRKYQYQYNGNYNNGYNNYNDDDNNNNGGQQQQYYNYDQQYNYDADDIHYEAQLSGNYNYQKAKNSFQCHKHAEPVLIIGSIVVACLIGAGSIIGFIIYLYLIYRSKPPRPYAKEEHLLEENKSVTIPSIL